MSKPKPAHLSLKTNISPKSLDALKRVVGAFAETIAKEGGDLRALHRELGDVIFAQKNPVPTEVREETPSIPEPPPSSPRLSKGPRLAKASLNKKQLSAGFSHRRSA